MLTHRPLPTPVVRSPRHHYYLHISLVIALAMVAAVGGVVIARASVGPSSADMPLRPGSVVVTVPGGMALLTPYIAVIHPDQAIEWDNADIVAHTLVTTPDRSSYLNPTPFSVTIPAGSRATLTLTQPGVYDYYDPSRASWNALDHHVAADGGVPRYPLAMEGLIWVRGPVSGLPVSASDTIPSGQDLFSSDIPAVARGGTVTWHNADTDSHHVLLVPGWAPPVNPSALGTLTIRGTTDAPPAGASTSRTFSTPGLYYYYCPEHADIDATWHRASAHINASALPIPMEGFILVGG